MNNRWTFITLSIVAIGVMVAMFFLGLPSAVLSPVGAIGREQRDIIWIGTAIMLLIVLPVFFMAFWFPWKFRESNKKAHYDPEWDFDFAAEAVWWLFPTFIVIGLSILTVISTYALDPFKPLDKNKKPMTIQVVALQWKWLFIYPEQNIATVNFIQIPEKTPIKFEITSDAPMNSFWIPALGGQIYAMPGMLTELHLIADEQGSFRGSSANISGKGFAGMYFETKATSHEDFDKWVKEAQGSKNDLNKESYLKLAKPSEYNPVEYFTLKDKELFNQIVMGSHKPTTGVESDPSVQSEQHH